MVTEEIFQSFLNCKTKSYLKFSRAADTRPEFKDWQRRQLNDYKQKCYDQLRSKYQEDVCLFGTSLKQALESGDIANDQVLYRFGSDGFPTF